MCILTLTCTGQICTKKNEITPIANKYAGCCGTQPVEFSNGTAKVYVPKVFTPDLDGINGLFIPSIGEEVLEIQAFVITSAGGDSHIFQCVYVVSGDLKNFACNGDRVDGSKYTGLFN